VKCVRKIEDCRIRAYTEPEGREMLDELNDWFDLDMVSRRQREARMDDDARRHRRMTQ
jgi:hypothetical protein